MVPVGVSLPAVQQIPGRARAWEAAVGGPEILTAARAAEAAGLAWVSCSDHVAVPAARAAAMGPVWYDAGSTLAFVAGATSRIHLLTHVLVLPYRHPLVVAKQYGTLDRLSSGRIILGVGSGHLKPEFAVLGASYERRGRVSDDCLRAIAAAWEQEVAGYAGETLAFHDVIVAPPPVQRPRPPIWVGGNSRAALRRAARLGDGWIPWQLTPEDLPAAAAAARALRSEARREEPLTLVVPLEVAPEATAETLLAAAARWRRAGATALHAGVAAGALTEWVERVAWLGREVVPRLE